MRRVQRRMQVLRLTGYSDYLAVLERDHEQVVLLFRDLLISVTSFFGDSATFTMQDKEATLHLFRGKDASSDLRIWVPACATEEEA